MFDGAGFVTLNVSDLGALDREREREGDLCLNDLESYVSKCSSC